MQTGETQKAPCELATEIDVSFVDIEDSAERLSTLVRSLTAEHQFLTNCIPLNRHIVERVIDLPNIAPDIDGARQLERLNARLRQLHRFHTQITQVVAQIGKIISSPATLPKQTIN